MSYHLRVHLQSHLNLFHASKLLTGVCGLARRGALDYTFWPHNPWDLDDLTVGMEVTHGGRVQRVVFDLRDRSTQYCQAALDTCDVYWKRSFVSADLDRLQPEQRGKVRPFGLNFPCRGGGSSPAVLRALLASLARLGPRRTFAVLREYLGTPGAETFVQGPDAPVSPVVLFQTRVWEPHDVYPDDYEEVNESRAELVRVLRRRLGARFWGGLVPTEFARQNYPDALTTLPTHRRDYLALCQRALVGVYSRGLHHSNAFKLSEYLAASQAIVSDALTHELPTSLRAGIHLLPYRDAEECAERCSELLTDADLARTLRHANHAYYAAEVEPAAHLLKCVRLTMKDATVARRDDAAAVASLAG